MDSRSATNPRLPAPAAIMIAPVATASAEAIRIACPGSPSAATRGMITAAIIGPSAESGPSTRMRDGPARA